MWRWLFDQGWVAVRVRLLALTVFAWQFCFLVSALGQVPSNRPGESDRSQIIVHVRAPHGEPLNVPAIVQLLKFDGTPRERTTAQGIAPVVFVNLAPGGYYVEVSAPGFETTRVEASVMVGAPTEVHVYMRPEEAPPSPDAAPAGPPVLAPNARKELEQGLEALRENNLKEAQRRIDHAAKLAPGHPDVFYLLGVLYLRLNDSAEAQSALEKATQLDPKHARALAALGTVLSNQGEYTKAIPLLRRAVELNDHAWETQWTLASAEYHERQFGAARDHARKALTLAEDKAPEIQLLLAQALAALGQRDKSAEELEAFLRHHSDHAKAPTVRRWLAQLQPQR